MNEIAISVKDISKRYRIRRGPYHQDTLRGIAADLIKSVLRRNGKSQFVSDTFWALRDISFDVNRAEHIGIIGFNGAGKSTLLKILSRITAPTHGYVRVNGRVGSLLEVGAGFHFELTGRENVFLYGAILGMKKSEIQEKFDRIVAFAEVEEFIDTPVKRYSSGMYVRLAFAVAAHLEPEILIMDEVLSVGDLSFQRKCMEFAKKVRQGSATILFVSHNMLSIKEICRRVIYLKHGRIWFDGPTEDAVKIYERDCKSNLFNTGKIDYSEGPVRFSDVILLDHSGRIRTIFEHGERMRIRFSYEALETVRNPDFSVRIVRSDGVDCCNFSTEMDGFAIHAFEGNGTIELLTPPLKLVSEMYTLQVTVRKNGFKQLVCSQPDVIFHVKHQMLDSHYGVFHERAEWSLSEELLGNQRPQLDKSTG